MAVTPHVPVRGGPAWSMDMVVSYAPCNGWRFAGTPGSVRMDIGGEQINGEFVCALDGQPVTREIHP